MLLLAVLTGCPRNHMPGGVLDRAARKDVRQLLEQYGCSDKDYENFCVGIEDIDELEECIKECGS
ncbi:hypothetical protein HPC49_20165 [Pyxidicoccus fallax]|uniref:Uncharacterized protein n=1 Tax=Pyxidicoccus fallax TaxID=394095 RepID=A0A848LMJ0_9BACT|nr:hypothetical protein [Pyxidicoccus fallax]NMO18882.1 hypothetical protein [Pyxidicoccus fallax]NPC80527.1 hypothetical protein [Pyxidicoccus fallax]